MPALATAKGAHPYGPTSAQRRASAASRMAQEMAFDLNQTVERYMLKNGQSPDHAARNAVGEMHGQHRTYLGLGAVWAMQDSNTQPAIDLDTEDRSHTMAAVIWKPEAAEFRPYLVMDLAYIPLRELEPHA